MTMNKIFLNIFFSIIFHSFIFSDGPYSFNTITEQDGLRNGPNYRDGIVYYPIDIDGPLPIIILVPGFVSSISSIEDWGPYLASYGVVTMFVNVNNIFQDPYYISYALLDGMTSIIEENERIDSPLFEMLNIDSIAVGGWSMGGGGAQLADEFVARAANHTLEEALKKSGISNFTNVKNFNSEKTKDPNFR